MRFREFNIKESIPAVTRKDLTAVGPNLLKLTKDLGGKIKDKIAVAAGQKEKAADTDVQVPPGIQSQMQVQPTAVQTAQKKTTQKPETPKIPSIPTVGSQLVLPDRDTKKPASFTVKAMQGNDITLDPVKSNPNDPKINVVVKKKDLQNTLAALDPNAKVGAQK